MSNWLKATVALCLGLAWATPACAEADYGTFGVWKVYSDISGRGPQCHIIPSAQQKALPAVFFLIGRTWPNSVIMVIAPLDRSLGLKDGQHIKFSSRFNTGEREWASFDVVWNGRAAMNIGALADLLTMAGLQVKSWRIDAPNAGIENLEIPLDGFNSAVNALARCAAAIGAR